MIKLPSKTKFKRNHRHHIKDFYIKTPALNKKSLESQNNVVTLISLQKAYLSLPQILNLRIFIRKYFKKKVKIIIPLLVNYHFTQKGLGVRMGKGKGKPVSWFIGVTLGSVIFRIFVNKKYFFKIRLCLYYVCKKLPIYTRIKVYEKTFEKTYCE
jgi:large subunit ribosomal protein L16